MNHRCVFYLHTIISVLMGSALVFRYYNTVIQYPTYEIVTLISWFVLGAFGLRMWHGDPAQMSSCLKIAILCMCIVADILALLGVFRNLTALLNIGNWFNNLPQKALFQHLEMAGYVLYCVEAAMLSIQCLSLMCLVCCTSSGPPVRSPPPMVTTTTAHLPFLHQEAPPRGSILMAPLSSTPGPTAPNVPSQPDPAVAGTIESSNSLNDLPPPYEEVIKTDHPGAPPAYKDL